MEQGATQFFYSESAQSMFIVHQSGNSNHGGPINVCDFNGDGFDDITSGSGVADSIQFYQNMAGTGFQGVYLDAKELNHT